MILSPFPTSQFRIGFMSIHPAAAKLWIAGLILGMLAFLFIGIMDIYIFSAMGYAKRIWLLVVLLLFLRELAFLSSRTNPILIYFSFLLLLGVLNGNLIPNIAADGAVLVLPWIFLLYSVRLIQKNAVIHQEIFSSYFLLQLLTLYFISLPTKLIAFPIDVDVPFLIATCVVSLYHARNSLYLVGWLTHFSVLFFTMFDTKSALLQSLFAILFGGGAKNIVRAAVTTIILGAIGILFIEQFSSSPAVGKLLYMITSADLNFSGMGPSYWKILLANPRFIFDFLDLSTAQRVFELLVVVDTISKNTITLFFGMGLGGSIDISATQDNSVLRSHFGDTQSVRVLHLGVSWVLLKGGIVGLAAYIAGLTVMSWRCLVILFQSKFQQDIWLRISALSVLLHFIGMQFSFAYFVPLPGLWLCLARLLQSEGFQRSAPTTNKKWSSLRGD
jgi:hypothetical protein